METNEATVPNSSSARSVRPSSSRNYSSNLKVQEDANKRNREMLSLVRQMSGRNMLENESDDSTNDLGDNDLEDEDEDEVQEPPTTENGYNPKEFDQIVAPPEIKELFQYITKYSPQTIELEYKLAPFIPDFIPAVGDIDAFIKIPRPDGVSPDLGLTVLDEPCTRQSDPAVLHLQLRAATKQSSAKREIVKKVENAIKNHKAIDRWIKDINNLHKSKHSSSFIYSQPMPDIDTLMQEWPTELEEQFTNIGSITKDLDCDLLTLVDIVCCLVDIPVYESKIESLHLLFSLYSAVKNAQMKADPAISVNNNVTT